MKFTIPKAPARESNSVSIVIPTRNRVKVLPSAVRSATGQTHKYLEVLVVDDGSDDDTPAVLRVLSSEDGRVRSLRQSPQGHGAARNRGMAEATGEWILFLDDDDILSSSCISVLLQAALDSNAVAVACRATAFRAPLVPLGEQELRENRERFPSWPLRGESLPDVVNIAELALRPLFATAAILVKRKVILDAGGFDESLSGAEDYDCWFRLLEVGGPFPLLQKSLVWCRFHASQTSTDLGMMAASTYEVLCRVVNRHPGLARDPRFRRRMGVLCREAAYAVLSTGDPRAARQWTAAGMNWTRKDWKLWTYRLFSRFPGLYARCALWKRKFIVPISSR